MAANDTNDSRPEENSEQTTDVDGGVPNDPDARDPSTWDGDRPPEGAVASKDDFQVQRDGEQNILPVWEPVPGTNREKWVSVIPARQGDANRYLPESGDPDDLSDRQIVEILNEFFVEPEWDLDARNAEKELEDIVAFGVDPLILAFYNASGFDFQMGMVGENVELLQAVEGNTKTGN